MKLKYSLFFIVIIFIVSLLIGCAEPGSNNSNLTSEMSNKYSMQSWGQNSWIKLNPVTKPSERIFHSMAYIGNDKIILFGGQDSKGYNDETWEYNVSLNSWTNLNPPTKPSARICHTMAYTDNNKIILYGGLDTIAGFNYETWEYDVSSNTWMKLTTINHPPLQGVANSMVYTENNKLILFNGNVDEDLGNTWEYDIEAHTWTNLYPKTKLNKRYYFSMVYVGDDRVIFSGGWNGTNYLNETWEYDILTNDWKNLNPKSNPFSVGHSMVYTGKDKIILYGGYDEFEGDIIDTWEYDVSSNMWIKLYMKTKLTARNYHSMAYVGKNKIILFGGTTNGMDYYDETWKYEW